MDIKKIFAQNIKELRKINNITQKELATKLGYSEKAIAKWESGNGLPSMDTFIKLTNIFNCSIDYLLKIHSNTYFLGIDGGGTATKYSLFDETGNVIARHLGNASNPNDYGYLTTIEELKDGINKICSNIAFESIILYAGISGLKTSSYKNKIIEEIKTYKFKQIYFESDLDNALQAGLGDKDGVVAIIGTGISVIEKRQNKIKSVGGWGYLIDEGGSGFNIGADTLKAYFSYLDGFKNSSPLFAKIEENANLKGRELCSEIYKKGKTYIASFAKITIELAQKGDNTSIDIVNRNVIEASKLILKAVENRDKNIPIRLTGSVAESPYFFDFIKNIMLEKGYTNISLIDCALSDGAAILAMKYYKNSIQ